MTVDRGVLDLDLALCRSHSGRVRCDGHMGHARKRPQTRQQLIIETLPRISVLIAIFRKIDARGHQLICGYRPIGGKAQDQTVNEDSGSAQQHEREGELKNNQRR